jgi:hypothetical protein
MNASNGALVSSIACDDEAKAARLAAELQSYKVGINKPRSRGDKAETFGGRGASWMGCFVGGELLVQAVTQGPEGELLYGNFPTHSRYPGAISPTSSSVRQGSPAHGRRLCATRSRPGAASISSPNTVA